MLPYYTLPMGSSAACLRRAETIGSSLLFERSFGMQCMQCCLHNAMLSSRYPSSTPAVVCAQNRSHTPHMSSLMHSSRRFSPCVLHKQALVCVLAHGHSLCSANLHQQLSVQAFT
jgi:hypothetical protein